MKTLRPVAIIAGAAVLVGGVWLYAESEGTTTPPTQLQQSLRQEPPTSTLPHSISVANQTSTTSIQPVMMAFATSTHTVGMATATPTLITVGTSSPVTVTISITDPSLIPSSVNLLQLGATGTQPTILGVMQGAGNGTYTFRQALNAPTAGEIQLQVSAAFQGSLKRVLSNVVTVSVWNLFSDANTQLTFAFPPMNASTTIFSTPSSGTSAATLDVEVFDPVLLHFVPMLGFTVDTNPTGLTLQQWFEQNIDDASGSLLASGAFEQQQFPNGATAMLSNNPVPAQYQGGPVSEAYIMSPSGNRIVIVDIPQDSALYEDFAVSPLASVDEQQVFESIAF